MPCVQRADPAGQAAGRPARAGAVPGGARSACRSSIWACRPSCHAEANASSPRAALAPVMVAACWAFSQGAITVPIVTRIASAAASRRVACWALPWASAIAARSSRTLQVRHRSRRSWWISRLLRSSAAAAGSPRSAASRPSCSRDHATPSRNPIRSARERLSRRSVAACSRAPWCRATVPRLSSDHAIPSTSSSSRNMRRAIVHSWVARSNSSCSQEAKPR